jgi:hypothetical protein
VSALTCESATALAAELAARLVEAPTRGAIHALSLA